MNNCKSKIAVRQRKKVSYIFTLYVYAIDIAKNYFKMHFYFITITSFFVDEKPKLVLY